MIPDRAIRTEINRVAHQIGQRAAQDARQRIAERLELLRAAGGDRAGLVAFLARCEQVGQVVDLVERKA